MPSQRAKWARGLSRLIAHTLLLIAILGLLGNDLYRYRCDTRGIEDGAAAYMPPLEQPRVAVNVSLQQYDAETLQRRLALLAHLGVNTIRQQFPWREIEPQPGQYDWDVWDRLVAESAARGMRIIAVLDTSPQWARSDGESDNPWGPPQDMADYARFASTLARRYQKEIYAYQIWDQPNLHPHWGKGKVSPLGYVKMLKAASPAIRNAAPEAIIVAGGLAPTIDNEGPHLNDVDYLREISRRGAGDYYDVLGAKVYGFWSGPHDRRVDRGVLNFSRVILLREIHRRGQEDKPVWALEGGWCALNSDWQGEPSPQGSDRAIVQEIRYTRAMERIRKEWPWMTLACMYHLQPEAPPQDPRWGYALLDDDGQPTGWFSRVRSEIVKQQVLYPGVTQDVSSQLTSKESGQKTVLFWGRLIALEIDESRAAGDIKVTLDHQRELEVVMGAGEPNETHTLLVEAKENGLHQLTLEGPEPLLVQAISRVAIGQKVMLENLWAELLTGLATICFLLGAIWRDIQDIPWRKTWRSLRDTYWTYAPQRVRQAALPLSFLLILITPHSVVRVAPLAIYGILALFDHHSALWIAVASIPFAPLHIRIGPGSFSVTEIALLIAAATHLWNTLLSEQGVRLRKLHKNLSLIDGLVYLLALLGIASCFWAEYQRVALRELRTMVIEPIILYTLVRTSDIPTKRLVTRAMDITLLAGTVSAIYALTHYPFASGVIEAARVRRARGFYGSPNNLALYLERILPLSIAVGWWGQQPRRKRLYAFSVIPLTLALILTFSRGAWLMGIPAATITLISVKGLHKQKRFVYMAMAILAGLLLIQRPRLLELFTLSSGTTNIRLKLWQAAIEMISDHPWLGVGLDNFLYYYGDYIRAGAEIDRWLSHPHNWLLDFWLRLGLLGVLWIIGLLAAVVRTARQILISISESDVKAMGIGIVSGMAACFAHGSVDSCYFVIELAFWFMLALAWMERARMDAGAEKHSSSQ